MLATVAALAGWWFVRNLQLYGDWLGWNAFFDVVGRRDTPATLAQLWTEREGFVWAYWGVFGAMNVIMPPWIYTLLNGMAALAGLGALLAAVRWFRQHGARAALASSHARAWGLAVIWIVVIFVALLRWTALTPASQGRLMFPAIAALAALLVAGLGALHRGAVLAACALLTVIALAAPVMVIAPAYARPPNRWDSRLTTPVDAMFGGQVTLIEAQSDATQAERGGEVTLHLNWRVAEAGATAPISRNYSVFVHLINADDVIIAQRDMYPGQGNLALAEVEPGYRWTDRYTLKLPRFASADQTLRWAVGLYDRDTGGRLRLPDGAERAIFGALAVVDRTAPGVAYRYANGALLAQLAATTPNAQRGASFKVNTVWDTRVLDGPAVNVSLQVIDSAGNKAGARDLPLAAALNAGTLAFDIPIDANAPPGVYRLLLVMYVPADNFRKIGAYDGAGNFAGEELTITQLRIR
jgi:hypothetical protein